MDDRLLAGLVALGVCLFLYAFAALARWAYRTDLPASGDRKVCRYCGRDNSQDENDWAYSTICPYCVSDMQAWV